jgi:putative ATPase
MLENAVGGLQSSGGENPVSDGWLTEHGKNGTVKKGEQLTFSPGGKKREEWQRRTDSGRPEALLELRNMTAEIAALSRHDRSLIIDADDGLLLWEISRRTPEGFTAGLCRTEKGKAVLEQYANTLGEIDRPVLALKDSGSGGFSIPRSAFNDILFDRIFFRDPFRSLEDIESFAAQAAEERAGGMTADGWRIIITQRIPRRGERISRFLGQGRVSAELQEEIEAAEEQFFSNGDIPLFRWDEGDILHLLEGAGFSATVRLETIGEKRTFTPGDIEKWFNPETSPYGAFIQKTLGESKAAEFRASLERAVSGKELVWNSVTAFISISPLLSNNNAAR